MTKKVWFVGAACGAFSFVNSGVADAAGGRADESTIHSLASTPHAQSDVSTEKCDRAYVLNGTTFIYAEHAYPGKTAVSLARISILGRRTGAQQQAGLPPGYAFQTISENVFIREGSVAVICGSSVKGVPYDVVSFVLPRAYKLDLDDASPW